MASSRPRRANAGSKMASLLNEEEVAIAKDDFYATTYGGFTEEQEDVDFKYHSPNEDHDAVDSDFSIDENDEPKSDLEDGEEKKVRAKRGLGVQTKAYKEPKRPSKDNVKVKVKKKVTAEKKAAVVPSLASTSWGDQYGRKEARASTVTKTAETQKRQKERLAKARRLIKKKLARKKHQKEELEMTQEEKLLEAKLTEKLNIASLKKYEMMELEARKKAVKLTKKEVTGPFIR